MNFWDHLFRLMPDQRGCAMIGFFALTFYTLRMIERNPALLANASFMQFVQSLAAGGILLVAAFLFGGAKTDRTIQAVKVKNPPSDPVPVEPHG